MADNYSISGALTIILGSGVISALTTYLLGARKAERDFTRTKLEVLWTAVHRFGIETPLQYGIWLDVLKGARAHEAAIGSAEELLERSKKDAFESIEMLVCIYFRSLRTEFEDFLQSREAMSKLVRLVMYQKELPEDKTSMIEEFNQQLILFRLRCIALKEGIYKIADRKARLGGKLFN